MSNTACLIPDQQLRRAADALPDPRNYPNGAMYLGRAMILPIPEDTVIDCHVNELRTRTVEFFRHSLDRDGASTPTWLYEGPLLVRQLELELRGETAHEYLVRTTGAILVRVGIWEDDAVQVQAYFAPEVS